MIPIELTIKGIYSYQKEQVIDFTRLAEGHLFGIFGAVGSGKSTILEAITLALYNNTERLGEKGDNRYYNMMNLKSDELLIRFVFRAGKDPHEEYLVEVQGKRHKKDFSSVGQYTRRMFKKVKGEWQPAETPVEEIIGLSYENFRRTIIIPQGKFQEFLQLTEGKRTQMMKELFQLERFDLQYKTKSLQGKNEGMIQRLSGQLKEVEFAAEELIEEKEKQLKKLRRDLKGEEKKLREKQEREKTQHALKEIFRKIGRAGEELENLRRQEEDFRRRETRLEDYQQCRAEFAGLIERRQENMQRLAETKTELQENIETRAELESRLLTEKERFKTLKTAYEKRGELKQKSEELERIIQIRELEEVIRSLAARVEEEKEKGAEISETIEEIRKEMNRLDEAARARRKEIPDSRELGEIRQWFTVNEHLQASLKALETEAEKLQQARQDIDARKLQELGEPGLAEWLTPVERSLPIDSLLDALESSFKKIEKEIREVEKESDHLRLQAGLEKTAAGLLEGHPCPVCGSRHHPAPLKSGKLAGKLGRVEEKREELRGKAAILSEARQKLSGLQGEFRSGEEMRRRFSEKQEAERQKMAEHRQNFLWGNFSPDDAGRLEEAMRQAAAAEEEIAGMAQTREEAETQLEGLRGEKEALRESLAEAEKEHSANASERQALLKQLKSLDFELYRDSTVGELRETAGRFSEEYEQVETDYRQAEESLGALRKELDTLSGQTVAMEKNLQAHLREQEKFEKQLREKLAQSKYKDLAEVQETLALKLDSAAEKTAIADFFRRLHSAAEQLSQLQEEGKGRKFDEAAYQELLEEIEALKSALSLQNQQIGGLAGEIEKLRQALQTKTDLQRQLAELEKLKENLATLASLFRGNGFVNFVSGVYLKNLCNAANERFQKLTRRQLQLEVTEDNNFQVRDFLHGGQARSIKTLSGGQTFQAALSLALALADNIQQLSGGGQNFFFLDEGFGTLDRESLRIVFDTLKSLRKENRIVGVISHVEDMQQEIDVYLKIRNDEEKGSLISASWEV